MPGQSISPEQIAQVVALRTVGFSLIAISDRTGVSLRSLDRVLKRHGVVKGTNDALVAQARQELLDGLTGNESIKVEAAKMLADDLGHVRRLRAQIADASDLLKPSNLHEAALCMRAFAAAATAIKVTSDAVRHSLRPEKVLDALEAEDLPQLVVREVSWEEVIKMRQEIADDLAPPAPPLRAAKSVSAARRRTRSAKGGS